MQNTVQDRKKDQQKNCPFPKSIWKTLAFMFWFSLIYGTSQPSLRLLHMGLWRRDLSSAFVLGERICWKLASWMPGRRPAKTTSTSPPFPPLSRSRSPIVRRVPTNALQVTNGVLNYLSFPYKELWHCLQSVSKRPHFQKSFKLLWLSEARPHLYYCNSGWKHQRSGKKICSENVSVT